MWPLRKAKPLEVKVIPPHDYSDQYISANVSQRAALAPSETTLVGATNKPSWGDVGTYENYPAAQSFVRDGIVYPLNGIMSNDLLVILTRLKCLCYANPDKYPAILIPPPIEVQYICAGNEKLLRQVEDFIITEFPDALTYPYLWKPEV